jgi:uncharacterized protein (TIGR02246 family)
VKHQARLAAAFALALTGCDQGAPTARKADVAAAAGGEANAVRSAEAAQLEAYRSRNLAGIVGGYAAGATVMIGGQAPLSGLEAIRASLSRMIADPAFSIALDNQKTDVASGGDLAYTRGTYRVTYTDPGTKQPVTESGSYVTILRKQGDGAWKVIEDIASPGAPPAAG